MDLAAKPGVAHEAGTAQMGATLKSQPVEKHQNPE
jgi:hypothetical protein